MRIIPGRAYFVGSRSSIGADPTVRSLSPFTVCPRDGGRGASFPGETVSKAADRDRGEGSRASVAWLGRRAALPRDTLLKQRTTLKFSEGGGFVSVKVQARVERQWTKEGKDRTMRLVPGFVSGLDRSMYRCGIL